MSGTVPEDSAMKNWNGCFLHLPGGGTVKRQRWRERHISALFPPKASLLLESVHPQLSLASSLVPAGEFQIRGNRRANDSTYVPVGWPFSLEATLVVFKTPKDSWPLSHRVSRWLRWGPRVLALLLLAALPEQVTEPPEPQVSDL